MKKLVIMMAALISLLIFAGCQSGNCDCQATNNATQTAAEDNAKPAKPEEGTKTDAAPAAVTKTAINVGEAEIALPKPLPTKATLTEAREKRRSIRAYTDEMLSLEQLSALLWSANGINREDGKRTAPSAMNKQSVTIFAAFEKGTYRYDHKDHKLVLVSNDDLRPVKLAPLELIFTSNGDKEILNGIDAGTASQNAALYCAVEDLATVIRMQRGDQAELQAALKLDPKDVPLFNMAIGFEKKD